jgi:hypothetical protein
MRTPALLLLLLLRRHQRSARQNRTARMPVPLLQSLIPLLQLTTTTTTRTLHYLLPRPSPQLQLRVAAQLPCRSSLCRYRAQPRHRRRDPLNCCRRCL